MDINILYFLIGLAIILFIITRFLGGWIRLGLGWISGAIFILIGFHVWSGEQITTMSVFPDSTYLAVPLSLGISNENFLIIFALIGLVVIYCSSGDWI